jgi:hypothetical protein
MAVVNAIAQKSANKSLRLRAAIASARFRAATGHAPEASSSLRATITSAKAEGLLAGQFEARLALGEIQMKSSNVVSGRALLAILERDAKDKGYLLMARKAKGAMASPSHTAE